MLSSRIRNLLPLLAVLLLGSVFHSDGAFFRWQTHQALLREVSVLGMLACGMTLVVLTGGIDLSVGSLVGLSAVSFATALLPLGWPAPVAVLAVVVQGVLVGVGSGLLITRLKLQPFIVTLAMMVFARGLAKQISAGQKVSTYVARDDGQFESLPMPEIFQVLDAKVLGGQVSVVTLVFLGCGVITWLMLSKLRVGRYLLAIGGNPEAAVVCGVPVRRTLLTAYGMSGLFAAVAGLCQAAQEAQGDPETGLGYELDAIAMVVLGGTNLAGGRGGMGLTFVGVLTLGYLHKILSLNAYSTEARLMLTGVILIVAVYLQRKLQQGVGR